MKRLIVLCGMLLFHLVVSQCSKYAVSNKVVVPSAPLQTSGSTEEAFQEVKSKWTVFLGSVRGGGATRTMGQGSARGGPFPIMVRATLMDDQVLEAGIRYYGDMASMAFEETGNFKQRYRDRHELDKFILIEAQLETSAAENYLDLSRYTIFLQDDRGNQLDPVRIVEKPLSTTHFEGTMNEASSRRPFFIDMTNHMKNAFLYFPRYDYYGNPTIHEDLEYLKLVFLLDVGGSARGEGIWIFNSDK